jgi:hypothetical protein
MSKAIKIVIFSLLCTTLWSQESWQQRVEYKMNVKMDVDKHRYAALQELTYYNQSPDTLDRVFYHLFLNAFQPGSMMDVRSQTIADPDPRVGSRIGQLSPEDQGSIEILSLVHNGGKVEFDIRETILVVKLKEPILPGSKAVFSMEYQAQIPIQIRRNGRDGKEGVAYSMTQWYPKICEYDHEGWHANPYIGREFMGVWGDFEVTIEIDKSYVVAAGGVLQNPQEIGYGYSDWEVDHKAQSYSTLKWHFKAENVHDFAWAADPNYVHKHLITKEGVRLGFFYIDNDKTSLAWSKLPAIMEAALPKINTLCGRYPYPVYNFIQGGDGGMEYPMATLITGHRSLPSLVGVSIHEWIHSWYYLVLATNEARRPWMDEGFTSWADKIIFNELAHEGWMEGVRGKPREELFERTYGSYQYMVKEGMAEPLNTHADHYMSNTNYGINAYGKGALYLEQLAYITGEESFRRGLLNYYNTWKFRHPDENDFIRIMEKTSGLQLRWYNDYWVNSLKTIDYAVVEVQEPQRGQTQVLLQNKGEMPMPLDVVVETKQGRKLYFNIPLAMMYGSKKKDLRFSDSWIEVTPWPWVAPYYTLSLEGVSMEEIGSIKIDPSQRLMDIAKENNVWPLSF